MMLLVASSNPGLLGVIREGSGPDRPVRRESRGIRRQRRSRTRRRDPAPASALVNQRYAAIVLLRRSNCPVRLCADYSCRMCHLSADYFCEAFETLASLRPLRHMKGKLYLRAMTTIPADFNIV